MKVSDLLTDASRWTQGAYGRDTNGAPMSIESPLAVCWCLVGALWRCYRTDVQGSSSDVIANDAERRVTTRIGVMSMMAWNDAPDRTFADVHALIEALDL